MAAYRFGHSMVRPHYRLNRTLPSQFEIFASDIDKSLVGQREFPSGFAVDWSLFFKLAGAQNGAGKDRLQPAYKIDTSLVNPLGALPPEVAQDPSSLILRDLERGASMGLPSGQAVARRMGEDVIPTLQKTKDYIAHYHTGGVPGRHEIDETQTLNYTEVMKAIVATGFKGYVAQEFLPTREPFGSLAQALRICDV